MSFTSDAIRAAAINLVGARRNAKALPRFPGDIPQTLEDAYAIQAELIRLWGGLIAGWKVGRLTGAWQERFGINRFIGPIFADTIVTSDGQVVTPFPAIDGGSAAFEAEIVAKLGHEIEPRRNDWTAAEAKAATDTLHIGIEVAGCAVADIGTLGPLASIAAFGNNMGLIVGPAIATWPETVGDDFSCTTVIPGVGDFSGETRSLPGGIHEATAFALNLAADLRITLPAGCWISTGAITGVHTVSIGQEPRASFSSNGFLSCKVVRSQPV